MYIIVSIYKRNCGTDLPGYEYVGPYHTEKQAKDHCAKLNRQEKREKIRWVIQNMMLPSTAEAVMAAKNEVP